MVKLLPVLEHNVREWIASINEARKLDAKYYRVHLETDKGTYITLNIRINENAG